MPDSKVLPGTGNVAWKRSHPHQLPAKHSGEEAPLLGRGSTVVEAPDCTGAHGAGRISRLAPRRTKMRSVLSGFPESSLQPSRPDPRSSRATRRGREPAPGTAGEPRASASTCEPPPGAVCFNLCLPRLPYPESGATAIAPASEGSTGLVSRCQVSSVWP